MIDRGELRAWLALLAAPGLGRGGVRRLLAAHGSPEAALAASPAAQRELESAAPQADRTLAWLQAAPQRSLLAVGDAAYPPLLLETADPPLLLYAIGDTALLMRPSIAIVGSRNPTPQGAENARGFAEALGRAGLTVVSGLALGIDAAAHEGALDAGAPTLAVIGTGIDIVYPTRHAELCQRIAAHGLVVSEFPLGAPPLPAHFPQRNRIIAGLSLGTLVVEAALRSGSLITARLAAEAGREVFALPGSIHAPLARGCHELIREGAKLALTAQDVLDELRIAAPPVAAPAVEDPVPDDPLLRVLGHDPMGFDDIAARTGMSAAALSARLLDLEMEGHVARLPGQRFQRIARA